MFDIAYTQKMDPARVARAIKAWQPLSSSRLTERDGEEIVEHMLGFVEVLRRWNEAADLRGQAKEVVEEFARPRREDRRGG